MNNTNIKFLKSHEWVKIEENCTAKIGISDHAQALLGDIVYVELPKIGKKIQLGTSIGVIESVKAASDLYSPVNGEIIAINESVINDPAIINSSPQNDGWLLQVKLDNPEELNELMDVTAYQNNIHS